MTMEGLDISEGGPSTQEQVVQWINTHVEKEKDSRLSDEQAVSSLLLKLEAAAVDVSSALDSATEELANSIPRTLQEIEIIGKVALTLKAELDHATQPVSTHGSAEEQEAARCLSELHTIKQRMTRCLEALKFSDVMPQPSPSSTPDRVFTPSPSQTTIKATTIVVPSPTPAVSALINTPTASTPQPADASLTQSSSLAQQPQQHPQQVPPKAHSTSLTPQLARRAIARQIERPASVNNLPSPANQRLDFSGMADPVTGFSQLRSTNMNVSTSTSVQTSAGSGLSSSSSSLSSSSSSSSSASASIPTATASSLPPSSSSSSSAIAGDTHAPSPSAPGQGYNLRKVFQLFSV